MDTGNGINGVREANKPVNSTTDLNALKFENGYAIIRLGSGDYFFKSDLN